MHIHNTYQHKKQHTQQNRNIKTTWHQTIQSNPPIKTTSQNIKAKQQRNNINKTHNINTINSKQSTTIKHIIQSKLYETTIQLKG